MADSTIDGIDITALQADVTALQAAVTALQNAPAPSVGPAGPAGPPGPAGPVGPPGPVGATGPAGSGSTSLTFAQVIAALQQGPSGTGTVTTGTTTTTTSTLTGESVNTATDPNYGLYPFAMPANLAAAAPINLGTGPDSAVFVVANDPPGTTPCVVNIIFCKPDGSSVGIAGPLTITSNAGESTQGAQIITLKGPWGSTPRFQIAPGAGGAGTNGLFINAATIDLVPMGIWGQDDSRGGDAGGAPATFISNDSAVYIQPATAPLPPGETATAPVVVPVASVIAGATINGVAEAADTLANLCAATPAGGTLVLPSGTFVGSALVANPCTITGDGMGKTIIDATNFPLVYSKAVFVTNAQVTIQQLTIQNGAVSEADGFNGAGVRNNDGTTAFTLEYVEITKCQNGVLTDEASVGPFLFDSCNIHQNGATGNPGDTHDLYIGGLPTTVCTVQNSTLSGCIDAHEYKSRCGTTISKNNKITTGGNGSCIDAPNGGLLTSTNDSFTLPATAADENFITFSMENNDNLATGQTASITSGTFTSLIPGNGGIIQAGASYAPAAVLDLVTDTYAGTLPPTISGFATVNGTITAAA
jgi:hypothetical protein